MSERTRYVLVDVGNSRIKYAFCDSLDAQLVPQITTELADIMSQLNEDDQVIVASVRNTDALAVLLEYCNKHHITFQHIQSQPKMFGISCAYQQFQNLGVDRWLGVLAARKLTPLPVAIIDLGTAATCDFVVGNQHQGGWISPGFNMMHTAVTSNADRVFGQPQYPAKLRLGNSTEQCVNLGCMAALQGMLISAKQYLHSVDENYKIFVCGGDANLLNSHFSKKIIHQPNLILQGLQRFI